MDIIGILRGILGLILLVGIAFLFSNNKKNINWRLVISGIFLQIIFAILILKGDYLGRIFSPLGWPKDFFYWVSGFFVLLLNFTTEGAKFVFDTVLASVPLVRFRSMRLLPFMPLFELYFYLYVLLFPLLVMFGGRVIWKNTFAPQ